MANGTDAVLLRIFVKENDTLEGKPLHAAIVEEARKQGIAGATVLRGVVGYGSTNSPAAEVSTETPMVIEIIDWQNNVDPFVQKLSTMMDRGLMTTEKVDVTWYQSKPD